VLRDVAAKVPVAPSMVLVTPGRHKRQRLGGALPLAALAASKRRMALAGVRMSRKIREAFRPERTQIERPRRAAGLRLNGKRKSVQVEEK
jgi:hypothetical protein